MSQNSPDIGAEDVSTEGWQARALGIPVNKALAQIPRAREMTCTVAIGPWREIDAHIKARGLRTGEWVRNAIINQYLNEGGDPDIAEDGRVTPSFKR